MSARLASVLVALCTALIAGGEAQATVFLGSAQLPLVEGSEIVACPQWETITANSACVSMPSDNTRGPILDAYQQALQERGFRLWEGSSSVGVFLRPNGKLCEAVTVEPLYLPGDGSVLVFEFEYRRGSSDQCTQ